MNSYSFAVFGRVSNGLQLRMFLLNY